MCIFLSLLLSIAAHASTIKFVEFEGVGTIAVTADDENGAKLSFRFPGGREQKEDELGEEFLPFDCGVDTATLLCPLDPKGESHPKILVRTSFPGGKGGFYVFRWDGSRFTPIAGPQGEEFAYLDPKDDVSVSTSGLITPKGRPLAYQIKETKLSSKPQGRQGAAR